MQIDKKTFLISIFRFGGSFTCSDTELLLLMFSQAHNLRGVRPMQTLQEQAKTDALSSRLGRCPILWA